MAKQEPEIRSESRLMSYFKEKMGKNTLSFVDPIVGRVWWTVTVVVTDGTYYPMNMSEYYESEQEATQVAEAIMDRGWFEYGNTYFPMHRIVEVKVVMDKAS